MLGQVDITRRYASVDRRRFSAIDRMFGDWPTIIIGDCTHKSPLGSSPLPFSRLSICSLVKDVRFRCSFLLRCSRAWSPPPPTGNPSGHNPLPSTSELPVLLSSLNSPSGEKRESYFGVIFVTRDRKSYKVRQIWLWYSLLCVETSRNPPQGTHFEGPTH